MYDYVNLFSGAGGWEVAARELGLQGVGIEWMPEAVDTARAAGFETMELDVRGVGPAGFGYPKGLIASPPCQTFSAAGLGAGRKALDEVLLGVQLLRQRLTEMPTFPDERTALVLEPLRWALEAADDGQPFGWIALEQVPTVLPVWEAYAGVLRSAGYGVATGVLNAEQYGVPQTRRRAILVARFGQDAQLPAPTHSKYHNRAPERLDSGVKPWVSMAEALGRGMTAGPSYTVTGGGSATGGAEPFGNASRKGMRQWFCATNVRPNAALRSLDQPAPTLAFGHEKPRWLGGETTRVTVEEAAILQTFPRSYPWRGKQGKKYLQVGNAIPPLLAGAVLTSTNESKETR